MSRPDTTNLVIELPEFSSPAGTGLCGTSYNRAVPVRVPYQGTDNHEAALPVLADSTITHIQQLNNVALAVASAQGVLEGKNLAVPVRIKLGGPPVDENGVWSVPDRSNYEAIGHLLDRARYYLAWARALWDYWAREWRPKVLFFSRWRDGRHPDLKTVERNLSVRWPLNVTLRDIPQPFDPLPPQGWRGPYGVRCFEARTQGEDSIVMENIPSPGWNIRVRCPTAEEVQQHTADRVLFRELAQAALLWARCAQEAAYAVGLYHLNKRDADQSPAVGDFAPLPSGDPQPDLVAVDPGPMPPELPPPPVAPAPEGATKKERPSRKKAVPRAAKVAAGAAVGLVVWRVLSR